MQTRRRPTTVTGRFVGTVLVVLVALTGCAGEQTTGSSPDGQPSSHMDDAHDMSGMAGMPDLPEPPASADWNAADATYLSMMIPHHRQALDLADLAATRADDRRVRAIAAGIDRGQGREIITMASWLVEHGLPEPTLADVEAMYVAAGTPDGMDGMLTSDQMSALAAADGPSFDRLFLTSMIEHHQGAIAMADELLGSGEHLRVVEMATDVLATQSGEIARMDDLLDDLP